MQHVPYKSYLANFCRTVSGQLERLENKKEGACILIYHAVTRTAKYPELERYCTPVKTFRSHMNYLKRKAVVITMAELLLALQSGTKIDPRWVVVSMDDALTCQVTLAAEILDGFNFPWTLAVPTDLIESGRSIWTNELSFLVANWDMKTFPGSDGESVPNSALHSKKREGWTNEIKHYLVNHLNKREREIYLNRLVDIFGRERFFDMFHAYGVFDLANWDQLRALYDHGVELIAHGATHQPMNHTLLENELFHEIEAPRDCFMRQFGHAPKGFAMPGGVLDERALNMIKKSGYQYCMTSNTNRISSGSDCFMLPRIDAEYPLNILRQHMLRSE